MTNMSILPLWLTHFIEILLVLEFQLIKFIVGVFSYKAYFRPQISSNASSDLQLDHFFWAKLLLPVLHQKQRIYHLISQVRKLLIKLAWLTMLGVKEILKVQIVDLTLYVWLCDRLSTLLTTFTTSSRFFSLHSLQQLSPSYDIQNCSSSRASHSLQLSPVEGRHGGNAPHQAALQTHRRNRGSDSFR